MYLLYLLQWEVCLLYAIRVRAPNQQKLTFIISNSKIYWHWHASFFFFSKFNHEYKLAHCLHMFHHSFNSTAVSSHKCVSKATRQSWTNLALLQVFLERGFSFNAPWMNCGCLQCYLHLKWLQSWFNSITHFCNREEEWLSSCQNDIRVVWQFFGAHCSIETMACFCTQSSNGSLLIPLFPLVNDSEIPVV